jgi:tRNA 2-thiouridine synthesizing protein D
LIWLWKKEQRLFGTKEKKMSKTLTILMMDPPYESSNTATAFRMAHTALKKGINVNVFAYEGATALPFKLQKTHPNPVKGTSDVDEKHPLPKDFVEGLYQVANENQATLKWINCGLCVDERGVGETVEGPIRGGPAQFVEMVNNSDQTIVIATTR